MRGGKLESWGSSVCRWEDPVVVVVVVVVVQTFMRNLGWRLLAGFLGLLLWALVGWWGVALLFVLRLF
jgi:hypothetical protein